MARTPCKLRSLPSLHGSDGKEYHALPTKGRNITIRFYENGHTM